MLHGLINECLERLVSSLTNYVLSGYCHLLHLLTCAARQGEYQAQLSIYVKSVVAGGAADMVGWLHTSAVLFPSHSWNQWTCTIIVVTLCIYHKFCILASMWPGFPHASWKVWIVCWIFQALESRKKSWNMSVKVCEPCLQSNMCK